MSVGAGQVNGIFSCERTTVRTTPYLGAFALGAAFLLVTSWYAWVKRDLQLHLTGTQVVGTVTGRRPAFHDAVTFEYQVGDRVLSGESPVVGAPNSGKRMQLGDPLTVFYLAETPSVYSLQDPRSAVTTDVVMLTLMLAVFGGGLYSHYRWATCRLDKQQRQSSRAE